MKHTPKFKKFRRNCDLFL